MQKSKRKNQSSTSDSSNPKYLFTDFDGVCNSYKEGSYRTSTPEEYGPSKTICRRIRNICKRTGARIIISSNWRKFAPEGKWIFEGKTVTNPLSKLYKELNNLIVGTLPPVRHVTKAEALILWLEENENIGNWVILDDDPDENLGTTFDHGIKNHYIQTNPEFGITSEIEKEVIRRLNEEV